MVVVIVAANGTVSDGTFALATSPGIDLIAEHSGAEVSYLSQRDFRDGASAQVSASLLGASAGASASAQRSFAHAVFGVFGAMPVVAGRALLSYSGPASAGPGGSFTLQGLPAGDYMFTVDAQAGAFLGHADVQLLTADVILP